MAELLDTLADRHSDVRVFELLDKAGREGPPSAMARLRESYLRARDDVASIRDRHDRLREVHEATGELVAIRNVDAVLKAITSRARRLQRCDYVYLNIPTDGDTAAFAIRTWSGNLSPRFRGIRVAPGHGVGGVVLDTGEPFQVADYIASQDINHDTGFDAILAEQGIAALLAVPLTLFGKTTGLLFAARRQAIRFSEDDVFILSALATHAAIALQNAELNDSREQALDELSRAMSASEENGRVAERGARLHAELSTIVLQGGSVADILDAARSELGLALAYVDRTSTTGTVTRSGDLGRLPDLSLLDAQSESVPSPALRSIRVGTKFWAIVDVASPGRLLGHLVLRWSKTPGPGVATMLERAGQTLALTQLSADALATADRRTAEELVIKLVQSPQRLTEELARRAQRNGVDHHGPAMVLADTTEAASVQMAVDWTTTHGGLAAALDDVLVVLAPAGLVAELDQLAPRLVRGDSTSNTMVGRAPRGLANAPFEFTESRRALMLARALGYSGAHLKVDQFGIFSMLFTDPQGADLHDFVRAYVGPLVDHDARHGTDLVLTALTLLEKNLSLKAAANVLNVHANTVNQRAARIDRLLRPDWRTQPRAFEVLAALKLHALQRAV